MKPAPVPAFVRLIFGCITLLLLPSVSPNASGAAQVDQLVATLQSTQADPGEKLEAAWQLGELGTEASAAVPALVAVVESEREQRRSLLGALNALGHLGLSDAVVAERVIRMVRGRVRHRSPHQTLKALHGKSEGVFPQIQRRPAN